MIDNPMVVDLMKKSPIPIPFQYAITTLGLLIMIVSGTAMLKGRNWARLLYVIWSSLGLLIGLATSPVKVSLVPGLVFLAIVTFFLFRPKANQFFSQTKPSDDAQPI
jgi:disulfide bond formation protein DsbB